MRWPDWRPNSTTKSEKIQKGANAIRGEEKAAAAKDAAKRRPEEERIQNEINELRKQQQALRMRKQEPRRCRDPLVCLESSGGETRGGDENGRANGCVEEEESRDR